MYWRYDGFGRLLEHTDLGGNVTTNTYNGAGQLSSTRLAGADGGDAAGQWRQTSYEYEGGTGYLTLVIDKNKVDGQLVIQQSRYSYDRAGNRITEQAWLMDGDNRPLRALQDHALTYDQRNQLTTIKSSVPGADYRIHYFYDAFGNREKVTTSFTNDVGDKKEIVVDYKYDRVDRVTEVSGTVSTTYGNPVYIPPRHYPSAYDQYYEDIPDDFAGRWEYGDNKAIEKHTITYDWAGNRSGDNNERYSYDALGRLSQITRAGAAVGHRYYDSASRLVESRNDSEVQLNDYDAGGRLLVQRTRDHAKGTQRSQVSYAYDTELGLLESYTAQGASGAKTQATINTYGVLRDTRLLSETRVQNQGEQDYKTSRMTYDAAGVMTQVQAQVYQKGALLADPGNSRSMISDHSGRLLEKTQNGLRTHVLIANGEMIGQNSATHESFSTVHEGLATASNASVSVYVVQNAGDKLTSIAKAIWGDERLWYLIADANGLSISDTLTVGQPLKIPAQAGTTFNGADTFKPYNAAQITGNTTPEVALPVPQQSGGGCGGLGQLVMIVVAVVVTIYSAGLTAGALSVTTGAATTWGAGLAVVTGGGAAGLSAGVIGAAAIGGAVGSIASQAVGIAIGAQDSFNWKGVALSAIGSGASAGVAGLAKAGSLGSVFKGEQWSAAAARAAVSNTVTQGLSVATGLQGSFEWRNVAASAVGAAVGAKTNEYLGGNNALAGIFEGSDLARGSAVGFAAGIATAVARGGKIEIARIATDAFGNALGKSLATLMRSSDSQSSGTTGNSGGSRQPGLAGMLAEANSAPERVAMNYTDYGYDQSRPLAERLGLPSAPAVSLASGGNPGADDYLKFSTNIPGALTGGEDYYAHVTGRRGTDALEAAAASDRAFYDSRNTNAENPYSAVGWHIGGLLNETGYDLARSARGAYRLATDSSMQAAAYNALKFAANNPGIIANNSIQGFKNFANKPFGQQADSVFKFAAGGFATAGTGKLGMLAVDGAVTGAKATARWVAPKVGDLVESYMYRTGGLAYMDKPVPTWNAPKNWQGPALSRGSWAGEVGNSEFILTNATAESVGVPLGSTVRFINGAPDFGPYAVRTPAGSPGSFNVEGLIYEHAADARTTVRHLANEAGMTPAEVRRWLAAHDVRMHHFESNMNRHKFTRYS